MGFPEAVGSALGRTARALDSAPEAVGTGLGQLASAKERFAPGLDLTSLALQAARSFPATAPYASTLSALTGAVGGYKSWRAIPAGARGSDASALFSDASALLVGAFGKGIKRAPPSAQETLRVQQRLNALHRIAEFGRDCATRSPLSAIDTFLRKRD